MLAYLFYPVYKRIDATIKRNSVSALITIFIVILVITLPMSFIIHTLSKEAVVMYNLSRDKISSGNLIDAECKEAGIICTLSNSIRNYLANPEVKGYLDKFISKFTEIITAPISGLVLSIPGILLNFFITLFMTFYFLKEGNSIVEKVMKVLPLQGRHKQRILKKFEDMVHAVVFGQVLIAIIQGILASIGFFIFGISSPVIWGIMVVFAAFIPQFGTAIIWFPAALMMLLNGYASSDNTMLLKGVMLIIYGTVIISLVDNVLKPKVIGDRGGLHPILVLLGAIGGLKIFGFIGLLVGPIILALVVTFAKIYEEER